MALESVICHGHVVLRIRWLPVIMHKLVGMWSVCQHNHTLWLWHCWVALWCHYSLLTSQLLICVCCAVTLSLTSQYVEMIYTMVLSSWSRFGEMSFQEYVTEGISHPVFYGDLVYKLRRVRCEANFVSSGSKIVKRLRRRKYDPLIIERTIGLVLCPSTALYRSFLEHCTLTNKAVGTIWRDLSKPLQRGQGPDPLPLWLLVGTPLVLGPELVFRRAEHSHSGGCLYMFLIYCFYHLTCLCNNCYGLLPWLAVGPRPL